MVTIAREDSARGSATFASGRRLCPGPRVGHDLAMQQQSGATVDGARERFLELAELPEDHLDLCEAALWIAAESCAPLDVDGHLRLIDELADGASRQASGASARERAGALVSYLHGDRGFRDDPAMLTALARIGDHRVVLVGHRKGRQGDLTGKVACNFGMPNPEGYRKAFLKMRLGERFGLPIDSTFPATTRPFRMRSMLP